MQPASSAGAPDVLLWSQGLRFSSIPWREARLFAVIAERKGMPVYELASRTSIIRWAYKPGSDGGLPITAMGIVPLGLVCAENSTDHGDGCCWYGPATL